MPRATVFNHGERIMSILDRIIQGIDFISEYSGKLVSLLAIPLTLFVAYDVFARYLFQAPTSWVYEMTWMQNGTLFLISGAYITLNRAHIRVDILYKNYSPRAKTIFDSVVYVLIFLPIFYILMRHGITYAWESISINEHSMVSYWQPPLYPIKTIMAIGLTTFFLSGIADLLKNIFSLVRR